MNYDVVVGVGCSFMNGDRIHNENGTFIGQLYRPGLILSKKLNCNYINLAQTGSSNGGMFRRIYEWVESNTTFKKPLFVIGLSGTARYPFYSSHLKEYYDLQPAMVHNYTDEALEGVNVKLTNLKDSVHNLRQWLEYYMMWIYDVKQEDKKLQREVMFLHHYLIGNDCDYRLHNSLQDSLGNIKSKINYISFIDDNYTKKDTWKEYLHWQVYNVDNEDFSKPELYRKNYPPYGKRFCDGHPSPNANKELAERIYESLK